MQIFQNSDFNFTRWRWHALGVSAVVVAIGIVTLVTQGGLPLGIDFSGGTIVVVKFDQDVSTESVREAIANSITGDSVIQPYGDPADREMLIRLPQVEGAEEGASLTDGSRQVLQALQGEALPSFEVISTEIVGPVIGADLQQRGVYAMLASLLGITLYIAFRFRFSFAVGALAAAVHDIFVTVALLTLFGYELSLNVVAAILTITGYSVNDTIVVFDRVRENLRSLRRESLERVINVSVNQTLSRTIITSATTFFAVLSLYLFGGEVLRGFAFTMLVGVLSGTYSTVFIASSIAIFMSGSARRSATPAAAEASTRPGRKARRAKAS
jgi:preprotein translocase subunit SecF